MELFRPLNAGVRFVPQSGATQPLNHQQRVFLGNWHCFGVVSCPAGDHDGFGVGRAFGVGVGLGLVPYTWGWGGYAPYYGDYGYGQPYPVQTWYYCADPAGYYPSVTQCNTGWQAVPAG